MYGAWCRNLCPSVVTIQPIPAQPNYWYITFNTIIHGLFMWTSTRFHLVSGCKVLVIAGMLMLIHGKLWDKLITSNQINALFKYNPQHSGHTFGKSYSTIIVWETCAVHSSYDVIINYDNYNYNVALLKLLSWGLNVRTGGGCVECLVKYTVTGCGKRRIHFSDRNTLCNFVMHAVLS